MDNRICWRPPLSMLWPAPPRAPREVWRGSWGAAPCPPMEGAADVPAGWLVPDLSDRTIVQHLRLSAGGRRLRLRLTNEYGDHPLAVGRVRVTWLDPTGGRAAEVGQEVSFSGRPSATLGPREPLLSDPIDLMVSALARLRVSLYLPGPAVPCSGHPDGGEVTLISPPGDFTQAPFQPVATTSARPFLAAVQVEGPAAPVIVTLGDSITDGYLSSSGLNRRWPDRLAERLAADRTLSGAAVVNAAISGNRLLGPDPIALFGEGALARLDRDVLTVPGVSHLVVLEGVNDLCAEPAPSPQALIAGYRQILGRAAGHRVKVILGTIPPYRGNPYHRPEAEAARLAVNLWIRAQGEAHGVIDFDALMRDPRAPDRLRADLHAGDWMHPNDAGYRAMGEAPSLSLFR